MLCLLFELDDGGVVYGFIPSASDAVDAEALLVAGLREANTIAAFAGCQQEHSTFPAMKRAAFIFAEGRWNLSWWTDGDSVYRTHWFDRNMPDPARYLGRPLMSDQPTAESPPENQEPT